MNKTKINKLKKILSKRTQEDALYEFLTEGNVVTAQGAKEAGIADPRRVINRLREYGHVINRILVKNQIAYSI